MAHRHDGGGAAPVNMLTDFIRATPPITLGFAAAVLAGSLAVHLELVSIYDMALLWEPIWHQKQLWRLLSCNLYLPFGLHIIIQLYVLLHYGSSLERDVFRRGPADYLWMLLLGAALLVTVPPALRQPLYFTTDSLIMMMLYVWTKNFPDRQVVINGLVAMPAPYAPFALMALAVMMGASLKPDLFGILAGHVWYFFTVVYPRSSGRHLVRTPGWLKALVGLMGLGQPHMAPPPPPPPAPADHGAAGDGSDEDGDWRSDDSDAASDGGAAAAGGGSGGGGGPGDARGARRRQGWQAEEH